MKHKSLFVDRPGIRKNVRGRCATTLVELVVVMTLVSIVLLIVGSLAVHLRQWDHRVRDHSQHTSQLAILAETIRADIRRAASVTLPAEKVVAIAGSDKSETRYELQLGICRRVVKTPSGTLPTIETFAIGPADSWKLENAAPGRRPAYTI